MSDQQQDERFQSEDEKDEVEAHHHGGRGKAMTDEPRSEDDESGDDFEAHAKKA